MTGAATTSPKISVITPCYNSETYIRAAIESVLTQEYDNYEHIVMDGASTDDTTEVLDDYSHLDVVSEPDDGIYDALNKGIARASGDYIGWLNADDEYASDAFSTFVQTLDTVPDADLVTGECEVFETVDGAERTRQQLQFTPASKLERGVIEQNGALLNNCLLDADLLAELGEFDTSFIYSADTEYLLRIAASEPTVAETDAMVYRFRHHDESLTFNDRDTFDTVKGVNLRDERQFMRRYMQCSDIPIPLVKYSHEGFRTRSAALLLGNLKRKRLFPALWIAADTIRSDPGWALWLVRKIVERASSGQS